MMGYITEPRVLKVLGGNRALVSTRGMRRVVLQPSGEVLAEFVRILQAKAHVEYFNQIHGDSGQRAVILRYETSRQASPRKSKRAPGSSAV